MLSSHIPVMNTTNTSRTNTFQADTKPQQQGNNQNPHTKPPHPTIHIRHVKQAKIDIKQTNSNLHHPKRARVHTSSPPLSNHAQARNTAAAQEPSRIHRQRTFELHAARYHQQRKKKYPVSKHKQSPSAPLNGLGKLRDMIKEAAHIVRENYNAGVEAAILQSNADRSRRPLSGIRKERSTTRMRRRSIPQQAMPSSSTNVPCAICHSAGAVIYKETSNKPLCKGCLSLGFLPDHPPPPHRAIERATQHGPLPMPIRTQLRQKEDDRCTILPTQEQLASGTYGSRTRSGSGSSSTALRPPLPSTAHQIPLRVPGITTQLPLHLSPEVASLYHRPGLSPIQEPTPPQPQKHDLKLSHTRQAAPYGHNPSLIAPHPAQETYEDNEQFSNHVCKLPGVITPLPIHITDEVAALYRRPGVLPSRKGPEYVANHRIAPLDVKGKGKEEKKVRPQLRVNTDLEEERAFAIEETRRELERRAVAKERERERERERKQEREREREREDGSVMEKGKGKGKALVDATATTTKPRRGTVASIWEDDVPDGGYGDVPPVPSLPRLPFMESGLEAVAESSRIGKKSVARKDSGMDKLEQGQQGKGFERRRRYSPSVYSDGEASPGLEIGFRAVPGENWENF